jgi:hypothetical protein
VLQSRRTGRIDSQLHAPAHHGRYVTYAPCFTLAELSAATITLRLATVDTSLPHRASLSPSWAHRLTITCSGSPRSLRYLCTVLHSHRAERIDDYPPPRHGHYTGSVARFTLAELGAFTITRSGSPRPLHHYRSVLHLSPSWTLLHVECWTHRLTIPCSGSPRSLHYLCTVSYSRRPERTRSYTLRLTTVATPLPPRATPSAELDSPSRRYRGLATFTTLAPYRVSLSPSWAHSQLHAPARHARYMTTAPCYTSPRARLSLT